MIHIGAGSCPDISSLGLPLKKSAKILGIWFARDHSEEDHYTWNYSPILEKMRKTCSSWINRSLSLSLKGKVTVLNSLICSQIQYVNMNTVTPARALVEARKISFGTRRGVK